MNKNLKIGYFLAFVNELYFPVAIWLLFFLQYLDFTQVAINMQLNDDVDLISVNIPFEATLKSDFEVTSVARDKYGKLFERNGNKFKHVGDEPNTKNFPEGTDLNALDKGKISITPISLDLTSEKSKENLSKIIKNNW